jgi:DNA-binding LytR/AlgR family response regulator
MVVEIKIDRTCTEPKLIIYTTAITEEVTELTKRLSAKTSKSLAGYQGEQVQIIPVSHILRIYTEKQKVLLQTESETLQLKYRLYELEEMLDRERFVRISNSEIVNFDKVKCLDLSISGTILLRFQNGQTTYVSRRYVSKIKELYHL